MDDKSSERREGGQVAVIIKNGTPVKRSGDNERFQLQRT